jgi:hypothetical protein
MDIGQIKQELLKGNLIARLTYGSSTYLKLINGCIYKFTINHINVWHPTYLDILAEDYIIYKDK